VTDLGLVQKKVARVETCARELETLARPDILATDVRERRFVEHTLQVAILAGQDVASHVVSSERLGEPRTNAELFDLLVAGGWLDPELGTRLRRAVGFPNVLVHGYDEVDLEVVRHALAHGLDDLRAFVAAVRARLPAETEEP
jgi:uncharacterized protein YutE (UPF0331/DUF86 family)